MGKSKEPVEMKKGDQKETGSLGISTWIIGF